MSGNGRDDEDTQPGVPAPDYQRILVASFMNMRAPLIQMDRRLESITERIINGDLVVSDESRKQLADDAENITTVWDREIDRIHPESMPERSERRRKRVAVG